VNRVFLSQESNAGGFCCEKMLWDFNTGGKTKKIEKTENPGKKFGKLKNR
jgi:hypothetical protein